MSESKAHRTFEDLARLLRGIDGKSYKLYRQLRGSYDLGGCVLFVDHVQADPFAAPSRMRLRLDRLSATFPPSWRHNRVRRLALEDYLARRFRDNIRSLHRECKGSGKSGLIAIDAGGQIVLPRTAVRLTDDWVEARLQVGLPAAGRCILGRAARDFLCAQLPRLASSSLPAAAHDEAEVLAFIECIENQETLRCQLDDAGLVAFIADGSILPRESGVSDRPLSADAAAPFRSPPSLRVEFTVPNPIPDRGGSRIVSGLGIRQGVTLIVGGGYHGKSTLLRALERAVYPHIPGDGREYVVANSHLVKVRAEDGRRIENVNINPFIDRLPLGQNTRSFRTESASGSTSQAANILEMLQIGAKGLLLDEDTLATNFMVRDARMQKLVHTDAEPITPFLDRVRELYDKHNVSTVLVMGGCGDYFDVADQVLMMREFQPDDVTAQARRIAAEHPTGRSNELRGELPLTDTRRPQPAGIDPSRGRRDIKISARRVDHLSFGSEDIDLRAVEQLLDISQTRAIGYALVYLRDHLLDGDRTLSQALDELAAIIARDGIDVLSPWCPGEHPGDLALPRRYEIAAALNRLRTLSVVTR